MSHSQHAAPAGGQGGNPTSAPRATTRSERDLEALASVSRRLLGADLDRQLGLTLRLAGEAVGANRASVMLLNPDTGRLEIRCSVGLPPDAILTTIGMGEGIAGWVAEHNRPFIRHGPVTDPRFRGVDPTIDASLCLPLAVDGRMLGVLNLTRQPGNPFSVQDLRLASSLADLAAVAVEKAALYATLRDREHRVAQLLEAAMNAQETERRRIAGEMHDGFLQGLTGLFLETEIAKITLGRTAPPEAVAAVEHIQEAIRRTSEKLRDHVVNVCPASVDEHGLAPSLEMLVEETGNASSLEAHFDDHTGERLPAPVETVLYRVAQEALRNVVRHAGASRVWVVLERRDREACLSVRDDGTCGAGRAEHRPGTSGLDTMRERLALAGGNLEVVALEEGGTRISARVPLAAFR